MRKPSILKKLHWCYVVFYKTYKYNKRQAWQRMFRFRCHFCKYQTIEGQMLTRCSKFGHLYENISGLYKPSLFKCRGTYSHYNGDILLK